MTRITATEASRNFSDILNRAQYKGESFEVTRADKVIVRIEPAHPKRVTAGEFRKLWESRIRLDPEDAIQFEKNSRKSAPAHRLRLTYGSSHRHWHIHLGRAE